MISLRDRLSSFQGYIAFHVRTTPHGSVVAGAMEMSEVRLRRAVMSLPGAYQFVCSQIAAKKLLELYISERPHLSELLDMASKAVDPRGEEQENPFLQDSFDGFGENSEEATRELVLSHKFSSRTFAVIEASMNLQKRRLLSPFLYASASSAGSTPLSPESLLEFLGLTVEKIRSIADPYMFELIDQFVIQDARCAEFFFGDPSYYDALLMKGLIKVEVDRSGIGTIAVGEERILPPGNETDLIGQAVRMALMGGSMEENDGGRTRGFDPESLRDEDARQYRKLQMDLDTASRNLTEFIQTQSEI